MWHRKQEITSFFVIMKFVPGEILQNQTPPAEMEEIPREEEFRVYIGQCPSNGKIASLIEIPPFTKLYPTLIVVMEATSSLSL